MFAFVRRAFGEHRAVGGEDRRARRQFGLRFELLSLLQPGEDEVRRPGDAAFGPGQLELVVDHAEGDGLDPHRHRHDGLPTCGGRAFGRFDEDAALGRDLLRFVVVGGELLGGDRLLGGVVQFRVHRGEVLVLPGFGEVVGGVLLGRSGDAHGGADDEGDDRDNAERGRSGKQSSTTLKLGRLLTHRWKGNRAVRRMLVFGR